jgi:hypothetical protein
MLSLPVYFFGFFVVVVVLSLGFFVCLFVCFIFLPSSLPSLLSLSSHPYILDITIVIIMS